MKLSKALLSAILIGITVQTITSCKKDKLPEVKKEAKQPVSCPACGMG
jgi:hypothetical protein